MNCQKCGVLSTVTLRKKDNYCESCFIININHKFRACIGKNKVLSATENVLVCLSGGRASTVMLNLINYGILLNNHKKLRINPIFLHVLSTTCETKTHKLADEIINQCNKYNFDIYIIHISEYIQTDKKLPNVNSTPPINKDTEHKFQILMNNMSPTAYNDFIVKIKRELYIQFANLLKCKFVFTAETTSTLAINLLSNLVIGRGSQVENDIGFLDCRNDQVKLLKPMRDISKEELDFYIKVMQLSPACEEDIQKKSLQCVIKNFVSDLQENFPATISTVCKIADKIGVHDNNTKLIKCKLCESYITETKTNLSALEATNFSRTVSLKNPQIYKNTANNLEKIELGKQNKNDPLFPFIHQQLCYGCSRSYTEFNHQLQTHVNILTDY